MPDRIKQVEPKQHAEQLIGIYTRRLQALEIQIARTGLDAPPEKTIEVEQIKAVIAGLREYQETTPDAILDRRDPQIEQRLHTMIATIMATVGEVANVKVHTAESIGEARADFAAAVEQLREEFNEDAKQLRADIRAQINTVQWFFVRVLFAAFVVLVLIGVILFLLARQ
jgi:hypothetical protein